MKPMMRIEVEGSSVGSALTERLLSMEIVDAAGLESDRLVLGFDDAPPFIDTVQTGVILRPFLGFEAPSLMGVYRVDSVRASAPPARLWVEAKAIDMAQGMKAPHSQAWESVTLGEIVEKIAARHDLKAAIHPDLAAHEFAHLSQTDESDLHFLTRLARMHGAIAKPAGGYLVFAPQGQGQNTLGQKLTQAVIDASELSEWQWQAQERAQYQAVSAAWSDFGNGARNSVQIGEGEPVFALRHSFASKAAASAAAKAKLEQLRRSQTRFTATLCLGRPELMAETPIVLQGLRPEINGSWSLNKATHFYNDAGYTTKIEAEGPSL